MFVLQGPEDAHESFGHDVLPPGAFAEFAGAAAVYDASFRGVTPDGGIAIALEDVRDAPGVGHGVRPCACASTSDGGDHAALQCLAIAIGRAHVGRQRRNERGVVIWDGAAHGGRACIRGMLLGTVRRVNNVVLRG